MRKSDKIWGRYAVTKAASGQRCQPGAFVDNKLPDIRATWMSEKHTLSMSATVSRRVIAQRAKARDVALHQSNETVHQLCRRRWVVSHVNFLQVLAMLIDHLQHPPGNSE